MKSHKTLTRSIEQRAHEMCMHCEACRQVYVQSCAGSPLSLLLLVYHSGVVHQVCVSKDDYHNAASLCTAPQASKYVLSTPPSPGLFAVSVLARLTWRLQPLVEAAILGQFVVQQVGQEMKSQFAGERSVQGCVKL